MKEYKIKEIPVDYYFSKPVFLDENFILAAPEMPFSLDMLRALGEWGFTEVLSDGEIREDYAQAGTGEKAAAAEENFEVNDKEQVQKAEEFYRNLTVYTDQVFFKAGLNRKLDFGEIMEKMKTILESVKEDRPFLLRALKAAESAPGANYLSSHSARSAIISIIIGSYLKLPIHRLLELGISALLHELGMLKLPAKIYLNTHSLSGEERQTILTHPSLGYKMLSSFNFPPAVSQGVLEHHERENGTGYPNSLTGNKISLYGKIIAVACSYEALTANRPYKDAKDGYEGMLDLLKNVGKQYDDSAVRALVYSLSIYPVGLYVLLSSGKKGQVVDVNPENPRFPIVQVFGDLTPGGKNRTLETSRGGVHIIRPLEKEETGSL